MKKFAWKKFLICTLAFVLMLGLAACSNSGSAGKILKIGVDDSYPPMEYKDESGNTVGFDIDLGKEIAKRLDMKIEYVSTAWDGIFTALEAEKFDTIISSLSITDERKKNISFTRAYIANAQVIVVSPSNTSIKSEKDLKGKIVGVQINTTAEEACKKFMKDTPFKELKTYDQIIQPFSDLKTGRLDAVVADEVVARDYVSKDKANYMVAGGRLTNEPIGIGFKKTNTALRDKVDKVLEEMGKDGTLKSISMKWFGEDLTSNIK